jgi:chromosome segregation ATPase
LEQARAEITRQHALFKKAVDECERLTASATHIQAELKIFHADRQQLRAEAAQNRHAIQAAEARIAELEEALAGSQQGNARLHEQIQTDVTTLNEQLTSREHELHERTTELAQVVRNYAKAKSDLSTSIVEATGLRTELHTCQRDFRAAAEHLAIAEPQLREAQAQLEALTEDHRLATEQRDEWRQRAEGFEHDLTGIDSGRDLLALREDHQKLQKDHHSLQTELADRTEEASKNNDALRGIINRQNTTLGVYHTELRRLRRARFAMRLVYGFFAVGLLVLGFAAFEIFLPHQFADVFRHLGQLRH